MDGEVLVLEPWRPPRRGIHLALERRGYRVSPSTDGGSAPARVAVEPPAAVVLDTGTPAAAPRATPSKSRRVSGIPVLMLARRRWRAESVRELLGTLDGCLVGPVPEAEVARGRIHDDGWIALDSLARTAAVAGRRLELARHEFTILDALVRNVGSVIAPARLAQIAWDPEPGASVCQVRLAIAMLRAKVGPSPRGGSPIATLPGYGYRYIPPVPAV